MHNLGYVWNLNWRYKEVFESRHDFQQKIDLILALVYVSNPFH